MKYSKSDYLKLKEIYEKKVVQYMTLKDRLGELSVELKDQKKISDNLYKESFKFSGKELIRLVNENRTLEKDYKELEKSFIAAENRNDKLKSQISKIQVLNLEIKTENERLLKTIHKNNLNVQSHKENYNAIVSKLEVSQDLNLELKNKIQRLRRKVGGNDLNIKSHIENYNLIESKLTRAQDLNFKLRSENKKLRKEIQDKVSQNVFSKIYRDHMPVVYTVITVYLIVFLLFLDADNNDSFFKELSIGNELSIDDELPIESEIFIKGIVISLSEDIAGKSLTYLNPREDKMYTIKGVDLLTNESFFVGDRIIVGFFHKYVNGEVKFTSLKKDSFYDISEIE